jgi:hypothetical protein
MALPTRADLATMVFAYQGAPFVDIWATQIIALNMDYAYQSKPYGSNPVAYVATTAISSIDKMAYAVIKTVDRLAMADIKSVDRLE